jgi:S-adenosylmethionine/arginine decarboxylase-like enzyme
MKCWVENPPKDTSVLNDWFINLVETVRMKVVAGPTSVYVSDPGNEGLTGTVTLATSHGSLHCWDQVTPSMIQFDLYSCSQFSLEEIVECFNQFGLISYSYMMIDRNDDNFTVTSSGNVVL